MSFNMNGCMLCLAAEYPAVKFCRVRSSVIGASSRFTRNALPVEPFNFSFFSITGWGIYLDYWDWEARPGVLSGHGEGALTSRWAWTEAAYPIRVSPCAHALAPPLSLPTGD